MACENILKRLQRNEFADSDSCAFSALAGLMPRGFVVNCLQMRFASDFFCSLAILGMEGSFYP